MRGGRAVMGAEGDDIRGTKGSGGRKAGIFCFFALTWRPSRYRESTSFFPHLSMHESLGTDPLLSPCHSSPISALYVRGCGVWVVCHAISPRDCVRPFPRRFGRRTPKGKKKVGEGSGALPLVSFVSWA